MDQKPEEYTGKGEIPGIPKEKEEPITRPEIKIKVMLRFQVPKGKVAGIIGVMNLLQSKFENLEIELTARDGSITDQDYEDKIEETFRQMGLKVEDS